MLGFKFKLKTKCLKIKSCGNLHENNKLFH